MLKPIYYAAILMALTLVSCNKNEPEKPVPGEMGTINLSVVDENSVQTKTLSAYTTSQDYEKAVKSVQVLIFDASGNINIYKSLGTATSSTISTTAGAKTVWAVVNYSSLSDVKTEAELKAKTADLSQNSKTAGFIMAGKSTCTVGSTTVNCSVTVSRLVSRVALKYVTNSLPASLGSLVISNAYISNVVGNQNLEGSASASTWYNKEGRADEATRDSSHIIDGSTYKASCPDLTFKAISSTLANGESYQPTTPNLFYGYPNSSTTKPNGFSTTFAAQRTVLVVTATVNGKVQYYPVFLDSATLERNKTYTVGLTVTGLGSDDPNKEVEKGSVKVTITVSDWVSGATYEETI